MSIKIETSDGKVVIQADDSSVVENITIDGKRLVGGPKRPTVHFPGKWLVLVGLFLISFGITLGVSECAKVALGSPLDCLDIKDNDRRHYCLALAKHDKLECEFIHDESLRSECRALAGVRP